MATPLCRCGRKGAGSNPRQGRSFRHLGQQLRISISLFLSILKGYHLDNQGKEYILQFALQNWWITDFQAYFNQTKATINIDCIEDSELLCLSLINREKLCSEMHKIEHFFRKKSNAGYVALQQRILTMLNNNPKERYEKLLHQNPILFQKVPKKLIASYLGVSRETLSRFNSTSKK